MSRDDGSLSKSEFAFQVRKCASCGAEADADDVYCGECGAELPPMAASPSTPVAVEPLSEQVVAILATLAPRDALRGLFAGFPGMVKDSGRFSVVAEKLFAQDVKRCTRYVAVQRSGVMLRLLGKTRVNAGDWERVISDLAEFCGFSREVCVECASEWSYALNVALPETPLVATPPSPVVSPVGQGRGSARSALSDQGAGLAHREGASAAGERLSLALLGNVTMEFVWCPPGTFTMGSPKSELGHQDPEVQHRVTLTRGFWMARYPTTQLRYKVLMGSNPSGFKGDARPVEMVSWHDAVAFCEKVNEWLSSALPKGFRCALPTEAQWEYACRAGTTSALNSGRELTSEHGSCANLDAVAWYSTNSDGATYAVGQKQANAWGLYDMHGNVWEWCGDWVGAYPTSSVIASTGPGSGSTRVIRGGSFYNYAERSRSASRGDEYPSKCFNNLGFRPVLTL